MSNEEIGKKQEDIGEIKGNSRSVREEEKRDNFKSVRGAEINSQETFSHSSIINRGITDERMASTEAPKTDKGTTDKKTDVAQTLKTDDITDKGTSEEEINNDTVRNSKNTELFQLISEFLNLAKTGAVVKLAYTKMKTAQRINQGKEELSETINNKIKASVGSIKENSALYDEVKRQKDATINTYDMRTSVLESVYNKKIERLLAQKVALEAESIALVADSKIKSDEKKKVQKDYKKSVKEEKKSDIQKEITAKKVEAERLAQAGDIEGANKVIAEYNKLNQERLEKTNDGIMEIAKLGKQIQENKEQFDKNQRTIKELEEKIAETQRAKEEHIEYMYSQRDTKLAEINSNQSIFKRIVMFASKGMTRIFNKSKAVREEVLEPIEYDLEEKTAVIEEKIKHPLTTALASKVTEPFKNIVDKAINLGKSIRKGAIETLREVNDRNAENILSMQVSLEGGR